jgi:nitrogen fixation protein FixH
MIDASGAPVTGLSVATGFDSPADKRLDADLTLIETAPGVYAGRLHAKPGQWDLKIDALRNGARVFKSINRIALQ